MLSVCVADRQGVTARWEELQYAVLPNFARVTNWGGYVGWDKQQDRRDEKYTFWPEHQKTWRKRASSAAYLDLRPRGHGDWHFKYYYDEFRDSKNNNTINNWILN